MCVGLRACVWHHCTKTLDGGPKLEIQRKADFTPNLFSEVLTTSGVFIFPFSAVCLDCHMNPGRGKKQLYIRPQKRCTMVLFVCSDNATSSKPCDTGMNSKAKLNKNVCDLTCSFLPGFLPASIYYKCPVEYQASREDQ